MGEADTLMDGEKVLATWKQSKPTKNLDAKALAEAHPEIHEAFLREQDGNRRFLLKGEK